MLLGAAEGWRPSDATYAHLRSRTTTLKPLSSSNTTLLQPDPIVALLRSHQAVPPQPAAPHRYLTLPSVSTAAAAIHPYSSPSLSISIPQPCIHPSSLDRRRSLPPPRLSCCLSALPTDRSVCRLWSSGDCRAQSRLPCGSNRWPAPDHLRIDRSHVGSRARVWSAEQQFLGRLPGHLGNIGMSTPSVTSFLACAGNVCYIARTLPANHVLL